MQVQISINECQVGTILAEDIPSEHGIPLVVRNTVLNSYIIDRLCKLGIEQITIYRVNLKKISSEEKRIGEEIRKSYNESVLLTKSLIRELAAGKPIDVAKINNIANNIYTEFNNNFDIIKILNETKEFDDYTYTHSLNVAFYSMLIGKWLKLGDDSIKDIIYTGLLHDVGKTKVPIDILNKKAKLSDEEFKIVKKHSIFSYELAKSANCFSEKICDAVLSHHEREDRSGYPFGIGSKKINEYAKIIAIADVYDAMTSDRVYKKRATPFEAFEMFQTIGVKIFDTKMIKTFLTNISAYYIGSKILLSTGETGEIAYIPPHSMTEPIISIGNEYIDLGKIHDKQISYIL